MKKGDLKKKKGFTIIEVSLVLAIAGLIFLMVFVALPQLQRQQRDSRRRDDILSFLETVKKYQTNNRGALPSTGLGTLIADGAFYPGRVVEDTSWLILYRDYLDSNFSDPDGSRYKVLAIECKSNANEYCGGDFSSYEISLLESFYGSSFPNDHTMMVVIGAVCGDNNRPISSSNPRKVATLYWLENGGVYCANT